MPPPAIGLVMTFRLDGDRLIPVRETQPDGQTQEIPADADPFHRCP